MLIAHSRHSYFSLTLAVWAADNKIFHIVLLIVFKLTEGRLELLKISVYLFGALHCVAHISLYHSWKVGVTMDYIQTVCMLV
jgi:hypothetical protein